jgi:squalene-hopene/tetraprenyl-beta-curcumene cyclase
MLDTLTDTITRGRDALLREQNPDGHFVFELEADATIPAEYVLLEHFLDRIEPDLQRKIGVYLRRIQGDHGGWPLFHDGAFDISASVKAYYALKLIGDDGAAGPRGPMSSPAPSSPCSARFRGTPYR